MVLLKMVIKTVGVYKNSSWIFFSLRLFHFNETYIVVSCDGNEVGNNT